MRARERHWWFGLVPALLLFPGAALEAQVTAVPRQDLAFGMLMPGVSSTVLVSETGRRAEWLLTGRGRPTVSFVLPAVMTGPGGALLPLVFAAGDAGWQRTSGNTAMNLQDPRTPFSLTVPNNQAIRLFLGGTAQPAASQSAGGYAATVTVILALP